MIFLVIFINRCLHINKDTHTHTHTNVNRWNKCTSNTFFKIRLISQFWTVARSGHLSAIFVHANVLAGKAEKCNLKMQNTFAVF